jgi:hypothetical protein
MRDFSQADLDAHLADLARNLTPEQAQRVKERVRERVAASDLDFAPEAIDGAFRLIGGFVNGVISAPNLGGLGERLTGALAAFDPRQLGGLSVPRGDHRGQASEGLGRIVGGLGRVWEAMPEIGGALLGKGAELAGAATGAAGSISDTAGIAADALGALGGLVNVGGAAGELAGIVLEELGDVLGSSDV